ncbi:VOC family protein [Spirosoma linguale]|uniref:Glyoxalase/bleomycin resistance protein/dioxygenase n=1 Tax=Spirosoma linguale (strain ATCC 33905 / DSM 74 / LMG 10896 / Claus 1) TaxID=504472 RepID=D2QI10_SPILD|nr:Glyoxalase/bleomycin resistance protein/dioxygenase [Spirosoma linguale DSM 74]
MKIDHIALWVRDLELMKAFYERYFGGKATEQYHNPTNQFSSYFLSFADGCRLELMHRPGIVDAPNGYEQPALGLIHLAVSVGDKSAVDQLTDQLQRDGYAVVGQPRTTGDGYYESVVLDPEGNLLELTT